MEYAEAILRLSKIRCVVTARGRCNTGMNSIISEVCIPFPDKDETHNINSPELVHVCVCVRIY